MAHLNRWAKSKSMNRSLVAVLILVGGSCSELASQDAPLPQNVRDAMNEVGRQQSAGFRNGRCIVRHAYCYTGSLPFTRDGSSAFLAVVIEVSDYGQSFDFDDIDLIDSDTGENLGSDPGIWPIKPDGKADTEVSDLPASPGPALVFLLYEREKLPKRIKLSYWGTEIVKEPVEVSTGGGDVFTSKNRPNQRPQGTPGKETSSSTEPEARRP